MWIHVVSIENIYCGVHISLGITVCRPLHDWEGVDMRIPSTKNGLWRGPGELIFHQYLRKELVIFIPESSDTY